MRKPAEIIAETLLRNAAKRRQERDRARREFQKIIGLWHEANPGGPAKG